MQVVVDIFWLLFLHAIGDFPLQTEQMLKNKYHSKFLMFSHCLLWTGFIAFGFLFLWDILLNIWQLSFLFFGHYLMDSLRHPFVKENKKAKVFDLDFLFHFIQLIVVYAWVS